MSKERQKGTGGETELLRLLEANGLHFTRTPSSSDYDLTNATPGKLEIDPLEALATRPDRGQWLVTVRATDFAHLLSLTDQGANAWPEPWETHIEVKRYARFSLHTIFYSKFGKKR